MKTHELESEWLKYWYPCFRTPANDTLLSPVYVDLGCSHPTNQSQTAFVRELGWRGIAVDGNEAYRAEWEAAGFGQHFVCEVLSDRETARFCVHENSQTSRISDTEATDRPEKWGILSKTVRPCIPLNDLLANHHIGRIDLLCVDLEGMTSRVLRTLKWEVHRPGFIIVEHTAAEEALDWELLNYILDQDYLLVRMFEGNAIFRKI